MLFTRDKLQVTIMQHPKRLRFLPGGSHGPTVASLEDQTNLYYPLVKSDTSPLSLFHTGLLPGLEIPLGNNSLSCYRF